MSRTLKHFASPSFWQHYRTLPGDIRKKADKNFELLKSNPLHPSLHLKKVGKYWSVRVGKKYRAIGVETKDGIIWFWIGSHTEYEKILDS